MSPRVPDAIASYQVFRKLRADGVTPDGVRFQVGLLRSAAGDDEFSRARESY